MQTAIACTIMRGGTSKGLYFRAQDLPGDVATRDAVLLAVMGSPDLRQIDGMGGAHPLTSKVAIVSRPAAMMRMLTICFCKSRWIRHWSAIPRIAEIFWPVLVPLRLNTA